MLSLFGCLFVCLQLTTRTPGPIFEWEFWRTTEMSLAWFWVSKLYSRNKKNWLLSWIFGRPGFADLWCLKLWLLLKCQSECGTYKRSINNFKILTSKSNMGTFKSEDQCFIPLLMCRVWTPPGEIEEKLT